MDINDGDPKIKKRRSTTPEIPLESSRIQMSDAEISGDFAEIQIDDSETLTDDHPIAEVKITYMCQLVLRFLRKPHQITLPP